MALDLQDQEELENIKRVWNSWGKWLFLTLLLVALSYLGWVIWQNHQNNQNGQATVLYEEFITKIQADKQTDALKDLQRLQTEYPKTIATAQATFLITDRMYQTAKYDEAAKHLTWLQEHNKTAMVQALTIQRLGIVKLQQKKYDEALKILSVKVEPEFQAQVLNLKGDVYLAQGKKEEANQQFDAALALLPKDDLIREYIEAKRNL